MKNIRTGTTSYIIPDDILPNVRYLADKVDDIELVLFESEQMSNLPDEHTIKELALLGESHGLSYTVHFPLDIYPGSADPEERTRFLRTVQRIVTLTEPLHPFGYVLHLTPESYGPVPSPHPKRWTKCLEQSLEMMVVQYGAMSRMFCIETLSYPFSIVYPLVERFDLSITLDIGHIWLMGYPMQENLDSLLPRTRIAHLHGVHGGKDHLGLDKGDPASVSRFLSAFSQQTQKDNVQRVLTLEVFSEAELHASLSLLEKSHGMMGKDSGGRYGNH
ncbi:MAG: sugar phosphate isomerase/epimerase [Spirochaetaceae bacterium]|jgi:sugar phosphate isomerase/epimerase|nr:sugar phosphate isomerase/epimerase [Spirochaetaceae bacterium]